MSSDEAQKEREAIMTESDPTGDGSGRTPIEPAIDASSKHLPTITAAALEALAAANVPPRLFMYGGLPVRLEARDGRTELRRLTEDRMRYELARSAHWFRTTDSGRVDAMPPKAVVQDVLADPALPLPSLDAIVRSPVFGPDGHIQTTPGYHASSRTYYFSAGLNIPQVSETPSSTELTQARHLLVRELLVDFPFVSDSDRAHAVTLLLLPFGRNLIEGPTPLHLIEKPAPGTGATLLINLASLIATGEEAHLMTETRSEDEWRKRITAALLGSPTMITIDNVKRPLDSAALSSALTALFWSDRRLGVSENVALPVRTAWAATGNNPVLSHEMARRTIRIRIDAKRDQPELRETFKHPDLTDWVKRNRSELVWALLTLVCGWIANGRPIDPGVRRLGSYESWTDVIGGILHSAEIPGFLENRAEFYSESDIEGEGLRSLVDAWEGEFGDRAVGVSELWQLIDAKDLPIELGDGKERSQKTKLGIHLKQLRDRQFGELRIVASGKLNGAQQWRLEPVNLDEPE